MMKLIFVSIYNLVQRNPIFGDLCIGRKFCIFGKKIAMQRIIHTALASFGMSGRVFHGPLLKINSGFSINKILERTKNCSAEKYPEASIVRSFDEILEDPNIDLVIVNTPDIYHYSMCKQALSAGKHVVVEKPFVQHSADADELISLAREKGLLLSVFQNRRWDGDFLTVKKVVENKMLGRLVEFESHFDRYRNFVQQGTWKEEGDDYIGVLYNLGSHMVDQALVLFGMPHTVTAYLDIVRDGGKVVDYYDIRLRYDNLTVILKSSYLTREPGPRYTLHGTLGSFLKWGIDTQEEALKKGCWPNEAGWGSEPSSAWGTINTESGGLHIKGVVETLSGNYNAYYNNIYDAIVNGKDLFVKPEQSRDGIKVLEVCLKSHKEQKAISLD